MGVKKVIDLSKERMLRNLTYSDIYSFEYVRCFCELFGNDVDDFASLLKNLGLKVAYISSTDLEIKFDIFDENKERICGMYITYNEKEEYGVIELATKNSHKKFIVKSFTDVRLIHRLISSEDDKVIIGQTFKDDFYTAVLNVEDKMLQVEYNFADDYDPNISKFVAYYEKVEDYLFSIASRKLDNVDFLFEIDSEFLKIHDINEKEIECTLVLYGNKICMTDPDADPICNIIKEYGVLTDVSETEEDAHIALFKDGSWKYVSEISTLLYDSVNKVYAHAFPEDVNDLFLDIPKIKEKVISKMKKYF